MVVLLQIVAAAIGFSQASLMHGFSSSPRGALLSARSIPVLLSAASPTEGDGIAPARNVLGGELQCCCANVGGSGIGTGFYRDGHCSTGQQDEGRHTVCIEATEEFLKFSKAVGNDLSTPMQPHHLKQVALIKLKRGISRGSCTERLVGDACPGKCQFKLASARK